MKHIFLFLLMVWAALGVCNCVVDTSRQDGAVSDNGQGITAPPETTPPKTETQKTAILHINELRTEYEEYLKRAEYIEFKVTKGGGMGGLYLYSIMNNAQEPFIYTFPAVDTASGEYITLHLRTFDQYISCDELEDDLTISRGNESCPTARDLWVAGSNKLLDKTGIVYIKDANGTIMDAVVLNERPVGTLNGNQPHFAEITESLCNAGMWQSADAVNTSTIGGSVYKSVSRYENKENTHSANDWYITIMGNYTPGQPNQ